IGIDPASLLAISEDGLESCQVGSGSLDCFWSIDPRENPVGDVRLQGFFQSDRDLDLLIKILRIKDGMASLVFDFQATTMFRLGDVKHMGLRRGHRLGITSVIQGQRLPKSVVDPKYPNHVPFKIQNLDEAFSWPEKLELNVLVLNDEDSLATQHEMCIES